MFTLFKQLWAVYKAQDEWVKSHFPPEPSPEWEEYCRIARANRLAVLRTCRGCQDQATVNQPLKE